MFGINLLYTLVDPLFVILTLHFSGFCLNLNKPVKLNHCTRELNFQAIFDACLLKIC